MATEGGNKVGLKRKLTGPARLLLLGKTRKGSESRANRRQAAGGGGGEEGGVSGTQEEVREEVDVCCGADAQTARGSRSPDEEEKWAEEEEEEGGGTRKSQKGAWRRFLSPAFTCFRRRRRRPRPESSSATTAGRPGEQLMGPSSRGAKRKRRFPVLTWPPPLFRHLLTSSREQGRSAGDDAPETRHPPGAGLNADGRLRNAQEPAGRGSEADKPEPVALENNHDALCLSEAVLDQTEDGGLALTIAEHRRSDLDVFVVEMSVQEPEAATESQLECFGPAAAAEGDPRERPTDRSRDPAHNNDPVDIATAAANTLLGDEAGPAAAGSSGEEEPPAAGLSNGLHRVGVAMVTNDLLAARCPSSADAAVVVPLIRLNSGGEDGASDWEAAGVEAAPLEDGVAVEADWEAKGGGGGGGGDDDDDDDDGEAQLVLAAQAVVQAAMLAAVQQLLREQQNSVDHVHRHDRHHLSPDP